MRLSTEEIQKYVDEKGWMKKYEADPYELSRYGVLMWLEKEHILELLGVLKERVGNDVNLREICVSNEMCGIDIGNNPTNRKAILCQDECPLMQVI